jgi:hypothetical protein
MPPISPGACRACSGSSAGGVSSRIEYSWSLTAPDKYTTFEPSGV